MSGCPNNTNANDALPQPVSIVDTSSQLQSPSDNISQLTTPTRSHAPSLSSPLRPIDIGVPPTPPENTLIPVDAVACEEGFDSDGEQAPWLAAPLPDFNDPTLEEDELPLEVDEETTLFMSVEAAIFSQPDTVTPTLTQVEIERMKVGELKVELSKRGLPVRGLKKALVERLQKAVSENVPMMNNGGQQSSGENGATENVGAGQHFCPTAQWKLLECTGEFLNETATASNLRAPTVPFGETSLVMKRNYAEEFDRMQFNGKATYPRRIRGLGNIAIIDGVAQYEATKRPTNDTVPNIQWIKKNKLSLSSHPAEWFDCFFPRHKHGHDTHPFCVSSLCSWTNTKAVMSNAALGGKYNDYANFSMNELMQHIGVYFLHALSPSPRIEMKFESQVEDPVNGNDFIHQAFGGSAWKAVRRHKHFKCFFTSVNPLIPVPSREVHPNWKVHPLLKWMIKVSQEAVHLGRDLSCDEQTVGFQGMHKDKQRITYKKEGDGFLADCICSDGYTYSFHFRHQPASQKIMRQMDCSPLHARVLGLISQLPGKYYTLGMDNLYNSTKLCRLAYGMPQKVMVHGVTRPSLRGIPSIIKQDIVTRKSDLVQVRHTVKVAVLKGDAVCNDMVAVSIYDTKPVYMLSMACDKVGWVKKEKKVYDSEKKRL